MPTTLSFFSTNRDHPDLHSFPTRRSSDLDDRLLGRIGEHDLRVALRPGRRGARSEEHTSELQSQSNLVCRLLLDKKNVCVAAQFVGWSCYAAGCATMAVARSTRWVTTRGV